MSLTRVDCAIFRGLSAPAQGASFRLFSPAAQAGSLAGVFVKGSDDRVASKVAMQLALSKFVELILTPLLNPESLKSQTPIDQLAFDFEESLDFGGTVLQQAITEVNREIYEFGHQLAAGGQMTAELVAFVMRAGRLAGARVGDAGLYLVRNGEIFEFFERAERGLGDRLLGAGVTIDVEFSNLALEPRDTVVVLPQALGSFGMEQLRIALRDRPCSASAVAKRLYSDLDVIPYVLLIETGPNAIYLSNRHETVQQVQ